MSGGRGDVLTPLPKAAFGARHSCGQLVHALALSDGTDEKHEANDDQHRHQTNCLSCEKCDGHDILLSAIIVVRRSHVKNGSHQTRSL